MILTNEQESALTALLDIVFSTGLFESDGCGGEYVYTTGKTLDLESMDSEDYEELKKLNEKLNKNGNYEYCI